MRLPEPFRRFRPRGEFTRGTLTIVGGTGAAQALSIVVAPVLTRLFSPSDYGVYSVATSFLAVFVSISCLRYEFAIPLPEDDVAAANVLGLSTIVNLGMSVAVGIILSLFGSSLLDVFGAASLSPYIMLLVLAQFGGGLTSALINWAIRTKDFAEIAVNRLSQGIALSGVQVALGVVGFGAPGLVIGAVAGNLAGSVRLGQAAWRSNAAALRQITWAGMAAAANRYRRFPIFSSGSALLGSFGIRAPFLLLVALFGTVVGGQYALAERLCYLPLTLVAGAVGQVYIAESARLAREQPGDLAGLFVRTTRTLAMVAIVPAILIAILAPLLAGLVFGARWTEAGMFVAILVPMFYVAFVATSTGDILYVLERQGLHLVREVLRLGFLGGSVLIAAAIHLSPEGAVAVLSAAGSLTYLLYVVISWRAIVTYRPRPRPESSGRRGPDRDEPLSAP
jgi:O-antigen/teichoic acid export membrane protein